tara:strand:- start:587 stop:1225 length:639 start_codon:yes stop_codon:yes gene_type:complete
MNWDYDKTRGEKIAEAGMRAATISIVSAMKRCIGPSVLAPDTNSIDKAAKAPPEGEREGSMIDPRDHLARDLEGMLENHPKARAMIKAVILCSGPAFVALRHSRSTRSELHQIGLDRMGQLFGLLKDMFGHEWGSALNEAMMLANRLVRNDSTLVAALCADIDEQERGEVDANKLAGIISKDRQPLENVYQIYRDVIGPAMLAETWPSRATA